MKIVSRQPHSMAHTIEILVASLSLLLLACDRREDSSPNRLIASILDEHRIVEPRLTRGSAYSPCREEQKPTTLVVLPSCSTVSRLKLAQLLRRLEHSTATRGEEGWAANSEALGDLGVAYLMLGNPASVQKAVAVLSEAARKQPRNAAMHSDLAAARIVLAGVLGEPYELVRSLDASEQALSLAPELPAARFNRALALERLFLTEEAIAAWKSYQEVDPDSLWGQEAETRARSLARRPWEEEWKKRRLELEASASDREMVRAIVDTYPQPVREMAQDEWLSAWAVAWKDRRYSEAERLLRIARVAGEELVRQTGDSMVHDAVAAIEATDTKGRDGLAEAHLLYGEGRSLFTRMKYREAEALLRQAAEALRRGESPLAEWAELFAVICVHYGSEYNRTRRLLEDMRQRLRLENYPALEGRILYNLGIVRTVQADFSGGLAAYVRALVLYRRTGEVENIAAVRHVIAESMSLLGQTEEGWKYRYLALRELDRIPVSQRRISLLFEATEACLRQGHPPLALALQSETLRTVNRWAGGILRPYALLERSRTEIVLGRHASAWRDLEKAENLTNAITDPNMKARLRAEIMSIRSRLLSSGDPSRAQAEISKALDFYQKVGARLSLVKARQERARLRLGLGDMTAAEADLHDGIEEYEAQRAGLNLDTERISFFAQSRALFDDMIALQIRLGRTEEAFSYAERSRARALLDQVAVLPGAPEDSIALLAAEAPSFSTAEVRYRLSPSVAVIEYHWLGERLCIWVITSDSIAFYEAMLARSQLARSIDEFLAALKKRGRGELVRAKSEYLFDVLLAPLQDHFKDRQRLVFVPDGPLFGLPFAALAEAGGSGYLIEDYEVVVAPSASIYLRCSRRDRELSQTTQGQVLVVGNPKISVSMLPVRGTLPAAEKEAIRVAGLYPKSVLLTGDKAIASRFLQLIGESEVVHFAGHAHVNESYPLLSALLLAPEAGLEGSGPVFAHQIYRQRLRHTRLVVLAACSTGRGGSQFAEEAIGLARPFLAAGTPAVVASLSAIGDAATVELLTAFHLHYVESQDPVVALRRAQLERIKSREVDNLVPWNWASFQVFGGSESSN